MKYKGIVIKLTKNKAIVTTEDFQCPILRETLQFAWGKRLNLPIRKLLRKPIL